MSGGDTTPASGYSDEAPSAGFPARVLRLSAVARKLSFEKGGDFILETRREVELYLASRRIRVRGRLQLYVKTVVAFAVWGASWVTLILVRPGLALGLVALGGLVAGTILIGFCVQHDAKHGAYFRTRRFNHLMGGN